MNKPIHIWTDKPKEVLIAIHKVKDAHFDDMVVMTGKQHASSMLCPMCGIRHSSLATERQKVEEMIEQLQKEITNEPESDDYKQGASDYLTVLKLRTKEGGREG